MQRIPTYIIYTLTALFLAIFPAQAAHPEPESEAGAFDVREMIFSHIGDGYEWHVTTLGDRHVAIPLPVIVHSKERGWHVFLSSKLHGEEGYNGFFVARGGDFDGKLVERNAVGETVRPLDLSITKNAAALLINSAIMIFIFLGVARWYRRQPERRAPRGFAGAVELFVMSIVDDLIKPCVGPDCQKYTPYLLTAFFFILINNVMGLIPFFPGGATTTGNIAVTLVLAVSAFLVVNLFGNREYWREIFWPDVPVWMKVPVPLMPAIELVGVIAKPFALMIRLFANMMAGHTVILGLTCLIFITASIGPVINTSMTVVSVVMTIFMFFLELLVAYIQAYVFTMLTAVFIGLSRPHAHCR